MHKVLSWLFAIAFLGALSTALVPTAQARGCEGPAHDCIIDALALGSSRPADFTLNTNGATLEPGEPTVCFLAGGTVWAKFKAASNGKAYIDQTGSANYGVSLSVFAIRSEEFEQLACDGTTKGERARVSFSCVAGETYYIQLSPSAFNATGPAAFRLEGCGETGLQTSNANTLMVAAHAASSTTPCPNVTVCSNKPQFDIVARASVDKTGLDPNVANMRIEGSGSVANVKFGTGAFDLNAPRPPPPPPPCGPGCGPDPILEYLSRVNQWAQSLPQSATIKS